MSFESAPTHASVPAAEKDRFDFRDDVYQMKKQEADRAEREAVENATYAAQAERAGKAGGRFDFSEPGSGDRFDFSDVVHDMKSQEADKNQSDQINEATYAAARARSGQAGGRFDFSQEHAAAVAALSTEAYKHAI